VFVDTLDLDLTNDSIEDVVTVKDRILLSSIQECCVVGDHHDPTGQWCSPANPRIRLTHLGNFGERDHNNRRGYDGDHVPI
jgi:hypothetical protein